MADLKYFQLNITLKNCYEMVINKIFNKKKLDSSITQKLYILIFLRRFFIQFKEFQALSKIPFFSNLYQVFSEINLISMNDYDDALICATNVLDNYNCLFKICYIKPLSVKNEIIFVHYFKLSH